LKIGGKCRRKEASWGVNTVVYWRRHGREQSFLYAGSVYKPNKTIKTEFICDYRAYLKEWKLMFYLKRTIGLIRYHKLTWMLETIIYKKRVILKEMC
jgi:hypothetical protein